MNRSICIVSTLLLFSSIISCKKDKDAESNKARLSKVTQWTSSTPSKGIVSLEFNYDDQNRVVEIAHYTGDSAGNELKSVKDGSFKCLYNGNETNPYKTIGGTSYYTTTAAEIFHTYNSNGQLIQDSIPVTTTGGSLITRNYTYYTDKIIVLTLEKINSNTTTKRDSFLLADHNIKEFYKFYNPAQTTVSGYKLTYDNKTNPISRLNIAALTSVSGVDGIPSILAPGNCNNNITQFTQGYSTGAGNFTALTTLGYTYSYNNNLPIACSYNDGFNTYTYKYEYLD